MDNAARPDTEHPRDESDADRMRRATAPGAISVDLLSAFAGDRTMTSAERARIRTYRANRGGRFFSDLLYAVSHHFFHPEIAATLWQEILSHKRAVSARLGRNVRITVAALDYLTNITSALPAVTLITEAYVSEIADLAMRDGLTGLFNHVSSQELLALEFRNRRRYGGGVSLILSDVDDFKSINDRSGHQEGDRVLVGVARAMIAQTRDSDLCCRVGGDEFLVILRNADATETLEIAERLRDEVAKIPTEKRRISISLGLAVCGHATACPGALMRAADRAMYEAKARGKNRIEFGGPACPSGSTAMAPATTNGHVVAHPSSSQDASG